jgi:hypothetical protein
MQDLRSKNDVTRVSIKDVKSDHVSLQVKITGNQAQFQQLLSTDNNFKTAADSRANQSRLEYYWMGNQA